MAILIKRSVLLRDKKELLIAYGKLNDINWEDTIEVLNNLPDNPWFAEITSDVIKEIGAAFEFLDTANPQEKEEYEEVIDLYHSTREMIQSFVRDNLIKDQASIDPQIFKMIFETLKTLTFDIEEAYKHIMDNANIIMEFDELREKQDQSLDTAYLNQQSRKTEGIKEWQKFNKGRLYAAVKRYKEKNRDKINEKQRQYYSNHSDEDKLRIKNKMKENSAARRKKEKQLKQLEQLEKLKALLG